MNDFEYNKKSESGYWTFEWDDCDDVGGLGMGCSPNENFKGEEQGRLDRIRLHQKYDYDSALSCS